MTLLKGASLPSLVGIGLRPPHINEILETKPPIGWLEVHSENFFQERGVALSTLLKIRGNYPISLHGVGLSLGSAEELDKDHLKKIATLVAQVEPFLLSEHLSWSRYAGVYLPDLLPVPYTEESLSIMVKNVNQTQDYLKRELLIENPSSYYEFKESTLSETAFLKALCQRTGAKLLLDINNVYVSAFNHDWDSEAYLKQIPAELVGEIHLAGHEQKGFEDGTSLRIDTHSRSVSAEVWELFRCALKQGMRCPTLIEWDKDIPSLDELLKEAKKAEAYIDQEEQTAWVA